MKPYVWTRAKKSYSNGDCVQVMALPAGLTEGVPATARLTIAVLDDRTLGSLRALFARMAERGTVRAKPWLEAADAEIALRAVEP